MRARTIAAGLCLGLLGLGAPQAHATGADSNFAAGCRLLTLDDTSPGGYLGGQDHWVGAWYAVTVLYSPTYGNVVNATVSCVLTVNGVVVAQAPAHSGSGVVAFADTLTFTAAVTDVVGTCTIVDFTSDDTPTRTVCPDATYSDLIQPWQFALIDATVEFVTMVSDPFVSAVNDQVCRVLQALAPGSDPVPIAPDGDVYLLGERAYDCPPYVRTPGDSWSLTGLTGGGWDDGNVGFLTLVTPETITAGYPVSTAPHDVAATCAFRRGTDGTVTVVGHATAGRPAVADTTAVHCRLLDATGATLYDRAVTATGPVASLSDTVAAAAVNVSVCTEGTGTWGTTTATTGFHCRYA